MQDGQLDQVNIAKHCMELTGESTQPIHTLLYRAGPNTRAFEKAGVVKVLLPKVIEPDQTV